MIFIGEILVDWCSWFLWTLSMYSLMFLVVRLFGSWSFYFKVLWRLSFGDTFLAFLAKEALVLANMDLPRKHFTLLWWKESKSFNLVNMGVWQGIIAVLLWSKQSHFCYSFLLNIFMCMIFMILSVFSGE